MFVGIHSEDVADELEAPLENLFADGADVSPVSDLLVSCFHRPVDLHKPSQNFIQKYVKPGRISFSHLTCL